MGKIIVKVVLLGGRMISASRSKYPSSHRPMAVPVKNSTLGGMRASKLGCRGSRCPRVYIMVFCASVHQSQLCQGTMSSASCVSSRHCE
eukprot:scaffold597_cov176-Amphora_coffeaeformis.AAC.17